MQYATELLSRGYGFSTSTTAIEFVGAVDGNDVGWSLGFMLNQTNFLGTGSGLPFATQQLGTSGYVVLLFLCLGAIIGALAVLVTYSVGHDTKSRAYSPI